MNTPNKLTVFRIVITPIFLVFLLYERIPHHFLLAFLVFLTASITDFIDGRLARKNNQITEIGKIMDPIADKMLTTAALLGFLKFGLCSVWVIMVILTREFAVTGLRMASSLQNKVIPANIFGKIKTAMQMVFSSGILLFSEINIYKKIIDDNIFSAVSNVLFWITAVMAVVSGIIYIIKSKAIIDFSK